MGSAVKIYGQNTKGIFTGLTSISTLETRSHLLYWKRKQYFLQCIGEINNIFVSGKEKKNPPVCWQPNHFFNLPLKSAYTSCLLNNKVSSHCASRHLFHFCDNYNLISMQFSQLKVWKHLSRCFDCRRLLLICWKTFDHWFITSLQKFLQTISIHFNCATWFLW